MLKSLNFILLTSIIAFFSCNESSGMEPNKENMNTQMNKDSLRYLALGDSYTIGESVDEKDRYPIQLQEKVNADSGINQFINETKIIATTGWTTDDLLKGIDKEEIDDQVFDMTSLLIGVNNQYRGYPIDQYRTEFTTLLDKAIRFAGQDTAMVFVVSIPDYGVTPFGQQRDPDKIASELDEYNSIAKSICDQYNVTFLDITPISREAIEDPELVATDRLHPSGKMYKRWVEEVIYAEIQQKLSQ